MLNVCKNKNITLNDNSISKMNRVKQNLKTLIFIKELYHNTSFLLNIGIAKFKKSEVIN